MHQHPAHLLNARHRFLRRRPYHLLLLYYLILTS